KRDDQSREVSGRNENEMAHRWSDSLPICTIFGKNVIKSSILIERDATCERNSGNARNCSELVLNLLLHTRDRIVVSNIGDWNCDAKRLELAGTYESRIDMRQADKGSDHQPGANQQYDRENNLRYNKKIARAMTFPACAGNTAAFGTNYAGPRIL